MTDINTVYAFKFSETAAEKPTLGYKTAEEFLENKYISRYSFGNDNLQRHGVYREMGWQFDFTPYLKKYTVKQYGQWQEYYAPNKSLLRKALYGKITRIIEI